MAQASSSFKHLDTHTFTYATPTSITEVLCLVTQVQLLLTTVNSELLPYIVLAYSYWFIFQNVYQCQGHTH